MDIKKDFPIFKNHPDLIYFDAAATSLKPQAVVDAVTHYYTHLSANVFRGDYDLSIQTSNLFQEVKEKTAKLLNVDAKEIIFTSGASESLNMIASGFGSNVLKENDVILVNEAEHASNVLPWFQIAKETKAKIDYIPIKYGHLDLEALEDSLKKGVKIVSVAHVSNVLGVVNDIKSIAKLVHQYGAYLVVDGAQSIGHFEIDLKDLDVDFYAYSAHKMFGPSGVGVLYGKKDVLEKMTPLSYGGGSNARFNICGEVTLKEIPERFESGTPNIEGVLGYGAAIDYVLEIGLKNIEKHDQDLRDYLLKSVKEVAHLRVLNPYTELALITFNIQGIFAQDTCAYLNSFNIATRSGAHCAKLSKDVLEENTVRLSMSIHNTKEDIDRFIEVIKEITLEKAIDVYL